MDIYEIFRNLRYHHENEVVEFKKAENRSRGVNRLSEQLNLGIKDQVVDAFGNMEPKHSCVICREKSEKKQIEKRKFPLVKQSSRFLEEAVGI